MRLQSQKFSRIALAGAAMLGAILVDSPNAWADSFGAIVYVPQDNSYEIRGGDLYLLQGSPLYPGWGLLQPNTLMNIAQVSATDGAGWAINDLIQADTQYANVGNGLGYLGIYPGEAQSVAGALGGNTNFAVSRAEQYQYSLFDRNTFNTTQLLPFAYLVDESGAIFTSDSSTLTPAGTWRDPYTGQTYTRYSSTFHIATSRWPVAQSLSASVQGNSVTLNFNTAVYLYSQLATYHYDAVQITNTSTGQTRWLAGTGSSDMSQMQAEYGTQGYFTDTFSASNLSPGSYVARAWVSDGVDRISGPVTTSFTIYGGGATGGGGGGGTGQYSITLTASNTNPTVGQPVTLNAQAYGVGYNGLSNGHSYWIVINDQDNAGTLEGRFNQYEGGYDAPTASTTAVSNQPLTDTYVAELLDGATLQVLATSTPAQVTWGSSGGIGPSPIPSPGPTPTPTPNPIPQPVPTPVLPPTLTANPTSLSVGQLSVLTATAPYVPAGDYLVIWDESTGQELNRSITTGSNVTIEAWVSEPMPESQTYIAQISPSWSNENEAIAQSNPVTVTWTQSVQISLSAAPTSLTVGQATTLTATVVSGWQSNNMWLKIFDETTGQWLGGSWSSSYTTQYASQTAGTDTFIAYVTLYSPDHTSYQNNAYQSNTVSVTWNARPTPPPPPDCGQPYDSNVQWVSLGNGDEELTWVRHDPTPQYDPQTNSWQCVDHTTQESKVYTHTVNNGQISGLSYDPGTPQDMWLPVPSSEWDGAQCPGLFCNYFQQHGFTGTEVGGPNANQISSNVVLNGITFHTYGPPIGQQTPTVWVRPDGGFGFRYVWQGSPHALPQSGTVTFTMTNPDGGSITWTKPLIINSETLQTQGTNLLGLDEPPPPATEVFSCWTDVPKGVYLNGQPELAAWSLSPDPATAFAQGAHISFTITVNTDAGSFTVMAQNVASTFGWPAYWFTRLGNDSLVQQAENQQPQEAWQNVVTYADPSLRFAPGYGTLGQ